MIIVWRWARWVCLGGVIGLGLLQPAWAEPEPAPPPAAAHAVQPQHGGGGFALILLHYRMALEQLTEAVRSQSAELMAGAHLLPAELAGAWRRVTAGSNPALLIGGLLAILSTAFLARHAVRRRLAGNPVSDSCDQMTPFGLRLGRALYQALVDLLALGAFALVALGLIVLLVPAGGAGHAFLFTYLTAALVTLTAALVAGLLLAPDAPGARLLPLADRAARFLYRRLVTLAAAGSVAWLTAALLILSGMRLDAHLLLAVAVGTLMAALLSAMILAGRPLVAATLLGDDPALATPLQRRLARSWHLFAIAYLVVVWALWTASIVTRGPSSIWSAVASVLLAAGMPLLDQAFGGGMAAVLGSDQSAAPTRARTIAIMRNVFRVLLFGVAVILLPWFWGVDVLRLIGAPGAGAFTHALFNILVTTLLAYVVWQLAETALDRAFAAGDQTTIPAQSARARTLRPLLRKFILGVLVVVSVMIALSAVGIDIGPLLAGAGVVGIALGFGAQTLVRDVVSGIFFLVDDAFRVGEYIEAGSLKGTVEGISIRSLRLRHHRGAVHTVPYGELKALTNHSRDWVIVKLEFQVTYDTDVDLVKKLIKRIGQEMLDDPELGPNLIETLKSQGIHQLADHGLLVRAKFTAKPGEQFVIRREALQRMKCVFEAAGIKFASPTVTIAANGAAAAPDEAALQAAATKALRAAPANDVPMPA
jgi:moderate conductance mechanosensitive channel